MTDNESAKRPFRGDHGVCHIRHIWSGGPRMEVYDVDHVDNARRHYKASFMSRGTLLQARHRIGS